MNYIYQINAFWERVEQHPLKTSSIAVYFALLQKNNRFAWKEKFSAHHDDIMEIVSISKNTFYDCRKELTKQGYIEFELSKNRVLTGKIKIIALYQILGSELGSDNEPSLNATNETSYKAISNLDKQINQKTIKPKRQETLKDQLDFVAPDFLIVFSSWLNHKSARGERYKSAETLQKCYSKLLKDSHNSVEIAQAIIDSAIGNNYAGFFPMRSNNNETARNKPKPGKAQELIDQNKRIKLYFDNE